MTTNKDPAEVAAEVGACPKCGSQPKWSATVHVLWECQSYRVVRGGRHTQSARCRIAELQDEVERMREDVQNLRRHVRIDEEIIAKLPKTADGVPVVPGMELFYARYCPISDPNSWPPIMAGANVFSATLKCEHWDKAYISCFIGRIHECYSTPELAKTAALPRTGE